MAWTTTAQAEPGPTQGMFSSVIVRVLAMYTRGISALLWVGGFGGLPTHSLSKRECAYVYSVTDSITVHTSPDQKKSPVEVVWRLS